MDETRVIIIFIISIASTFGATWCLFSQSTDSKKKKITQWLLWAVTQAEVALGSGTGALKLAMVYNMFVTTFPYFSKVISVKTFQKLVDLALNEMRKILTDNPAVIKKIGEIK